MGDYTVLEALMLVCFGASWPTSIYRAVKVKKVDGKSIYFLWLIFSGYVCGFMNKLLGTTDWVTLFYVANACMVFTDIILYYRYSRMAGSLR